MQCIPHLAAAAKELYVFQRTPSSIDVRGNVPGSGFTDLDQGSAPPGWQKKWQVLHSLSLSPSLPLSLALPLSLFLSLPLLSPSLLFAFNSASIA